GMGSHGYFEWSGLSWYTSRSADDVAARIGIDPYAADSIPYTDPDLNSIWSQGFQSLLTINTCLKTLQSPLNLSASFHNQMMGEALFCRAFINFYLVNLWGDAIPLVTTPDVQANQSAKSVPSQQIYNQIIADLQNAQSLLTNTYPSPGRVRPNGL